MPRGPRRLVPEGCYHVFARGNQRRAVFHDDEDRRWFLARLWRVEKETATMHVGHCLMGNHIHLIVIPGTASLSLVIHRVLGPYAQWFNRRHAQVGHLFQDRFGSTVLESEEAILWALRYVHRNPVEAGIVRRAAAWRWSSLRDHLLRSPPDYLRAGAVLVRGFVSDDPEEAIADMAVSAESTVGDLGGAARVVETLERMRGADRHSGHARRALRDLEQRIARLYGLRDPAVIRGSGRDFRTAAARRSFCRAAMRERPHSAAEVAALLGRTAGQVRRLARDGLERERRNRPSDTA